MFPEREAMYVPEKSGKMIIANVFDPSDLL